MTILTQDMWDDAYRRLLRICGQEEEAWRANSQKWHNIAIKAGIYANKQGDK